MANIGDVMRHCRNYFERWEYQGTITITADGEIVGAGEIAPCAYVAIRGSAIHDGVWRVAGNVLDDMAQDTPGETFEGTVWALSPPPDFVRLAEQIGAFEAEGGLSPLASESFGPYSYSVQSGQHGPLTWQEAYKEHLAPWRKMFAGVRQ